MIEGFSEAKDKTGSVHPIIDGLRDLEPLENLNELHSSDPRFKNIKRKSNNNLKQKDEKTSLSHINSMKFDLEYQEAEL